MTSIIFNYLELSMLSRLVQDEFKLQSRAPIRDTQARSTLINLHEKLLLGMRTDVAGKEPIEQYKEEHPRAPLGYSIQNPLPTWNTGNTGVTEPHVPSPAAETSVSWPPGGPKSTTVKERRNAQR